MRKLKLLWVNPHPPSNQNIYVGHNRIPEHWYCTQNYNVDFFPKLEVNSCYVCSLERTQKNCWSTISDSISQIYAGSVFTYPSTEWTLNSMLKSILLNVEQYFAQHWTVFHSILVMDTSLVPHSEYIAYKSLLRSKYGENGKIIGAMWANIETPPFQNTLKVSCALLGEINMWICVFLELISSEAVLTWFDMASIFKYDPWEEHGCVNENASLINPNAIILKQSRQKRQT